MTLVHAYRADWLKLRKRPAVVIMVALLGLIVLLFGYLALYALAGQAPEAAGPGIDRVLVLTTLSPANLPGHVLSLATGFGGALGLILGALSVGSEFSWRTVTTTATQGPRRSTLLAARAAVLVTICAAMAVAAFAAGALGSYLVTALEPIDAQWPAAAEVATAFGVTLLVMATWSMIGACLAMIFRGGGWAIGLGLLYTFAFEQLLTLLPLQGRAADLLDDALIGNNTNALVAWLSPAAAGTLTGSAPTGIAPEQAIAVLLAYLALALLVAAVLFARRDIT